MPELEDDILSPEAVEDPYGLFHRLRSRDPLHWSDHHRAWIFTAHEDVLAAFNDHERLSSDRVTPMEARVAPEKRESLQQTFELLRGWMVFRDPPDHRRLRGPVKRVFTPRSVARLRPRTEALVDELLDEVEREGECDWIRSVAYPLPAVVIAELLGVPPADRDRFKSWTSKLGLLVIGKLDHPKVHERAREAAKEFVDYFTWLIERYERAPEENLISRLIAARDEEGVLSREEVVSACTLLLFGGHETTTNLIANGLLALLRHPDEQRRLRQDSALFEPAVEELLRYDGPSKLMVRHVKEPHERRGRRLEPGERVYLALAGANRDPAVFAEPDRVDVARSPNPHLGFGWGVHYCLGASLARMETRVVFERLLARFPRLSLVKDDLRWSPTLLGRALRELVIRAE